MGFSEEVLLDSSGDRQTSARQQAWPVHTAGGEGTAIQWITCVPQRWEEQACRRVGGETATAEIRFQGDLQGADFNLNSRQSWQAGKVMRKAELQKNPSSFLDGWGEIEGREASKEAMLDPSGCSMEVD